MFNTKTIVFRSVCGLLLLAALTLTAATQVDWKAQIRNMPAGFAALANASPTNGQTLTFNGTNWVAAGGVTVSATAFNFPAQTISTAIIAATPATITLTPVPIGVNGTDPHHYLYTANCSGGAQSLLITGGTAVSGAASGTITFTPTNSCTAGWTIISATNGIQEAYNSVSPTGGVRGMLHIPSGDPLIFAPVWMPNSIMSIQGDGPNQTNIHVQFASGNAFDIGSSGNSVTISDLYIDNQYPSVVTRSSGAYIHYSGTFPNTQCIFAEFRNLKFYSGYDQLKVDDCNSPKFNNITVNQFTHAGVYEFISAGGVDGGMFSFIGGGGVSGDVLRIETGSGASLSGATVDHLFGQGGDNALHLTGSGAISESTFSQMILDNAAVAKINLDATGGGFKLSFHDASLGGTGTSPAIQAGVGFSDVEVYDFRGSVGGVNHFNLTAPLNWTIHDNQMYGLDGSNEVAILAAGSGANHTIGLRVLNNRFGYGESGQTTGSRYNNCVQFTDTSVTGFIYIGNDCNSYQGGSPFGSIVGLTTTWSGNVMVENNIGLDNLPPTISSANTITLDSTQWYPTIYISGTTVIKTITASGAGVPVFDGRTINLIFTNATPSGVDATGNIAAAITPTQNRAIQLRYDATAAKWFPLN